MFILAVNCRINSVQNEYILMNATNMYSLGNAVMAIPLVSDIGMSADY